MYKVALLIPTMNRPDFLIRQLYYYASVSSKHPIYIGDASNETEKSKTESAIAYFKDKLDIHYHHLPGMNIRKTITHLGELATEDFCAVICDDDYLVPSSLEKCSSFLFNNPDYRTAQGKAVIFVLNESGPYGTIKGSMVYWDKKFVELETAKERVEYFSHNYWVPQFSVHRRSEFVDDSMVYRDLEDESFGEILHCFTFICNGKSKFLDCLYLIRQGHDSRYILPGFLDWMTSDKWHSSYKKVIESIGHCISKTDGLKEEEGLNIAKKIFDEGYLAKALSKKVIYKPIGEKENKNSKMPVSIGQYAVAVIRKIPMAKRIAKQLKSKYNGVSKPFDFDFLLTRDSPYYLDAKPVFDNFTYPPTQELSNEHIRN